jgi:hypothetical protein
MPKRVKQLRRDVNQRAFDVVRRSTEKAEKADTVTSAELSRVMSILGRAGGKKGGKRRMETMTPEQRSEIALRAARARWAKKKR